MASSPRTFKLVSPHMTGKDIRAFQTDLNARFAAWDIGKHIDTDADYGDGTRLAAEEVCIGLGILLEKAMAAGVTPELRVKIRHPEQRTPQEIERGRGARAKQFRSKLRARFASNGKVLTGIDVSNNQATVDFDAVKAAGNSFAFHKVSEGLGAPDKKFAGRWKAIRDAGLVRGAYHFARPQKGRNPKDEVDEFLRLLGDAGGLKDGDLAPVLDIEAYGKAGRLNAPETQAWVKEFVATIKARVGRLPIIYTGSFWRDEMGNPASNFGCKLWLAAFVHDPNPFVPIAWHTQSYSIWQRTETGRCAGVSGNCDLNLLPGGEAALGQLRI
jgi:lysozyme